MSYATFATLVHLQPCPLEPATSLRRLRLVDAGGLTVADAEALAAALRWLQELVLYRPDKRSAPAEPAVLQRLESLLPGTAVRSECDW